MDEIGQRLRAARIEKGLTIDDLQQSTKIQKRYLIAIEEGQLNQLPGEFYERAFMKQYAEAVGLDSKELLGDTMIDVPNKPAAEPVARENKKEDRSDRRMEFIRRYLPQGVVILLVIVILGAIFGIATQNRANNQTVIPDKSETLKKAAADKKAAEKKAAADKKAADKKKAEEAAKAFKITEDKNDSNQFTIENLPASDNKLTLTGGESNAWIEVKSDNVSSWAGSLAAGASQEVTIPAGVKVITVHSGNARSTNIKINDTDVNITDLATGGFVRTFTFTIKN